MPKTAEKARILIVDDEPINIHVLSNALNDTYNLFAVTSGREAIAFCMTHAPDLVLMDMDMPDINGVEACKTLKEKSETHDIPIVFVTGHGDSDAEDKCWEAGGVDFLTKPVNANTLNHRIKSHLALKELTDELRRMAYQDGLTQVSNRRYFDEYLLRQQKLSQRSGSFFALLMFDIDFFKSYNDHYGHLAGDDCLRLVAKVLKQSVERPGDFVARFGGEEFAVVLPETDIAGAILVATKLLANVRELGIKHKGSPFGVVTGSIGIAASDGSKKTLQELIDTADRRLYAAKTSGRDQFISK
ncbi:MAG: diguanylate cyclase response regulator [Alteromonadaceae bacterium]|jgi:diguanylate cyclase (GGDEF)-like protein|nr:diguanylate cyclase response regulator [Alteromonadaceae bacterium]